MVEQALLNGAFDGGVSAGFGYVGGRIVRTAIDLVKLIAAGFVLFFVALDRMGVITIHVERAVEVASNLGSVTGDLGGTIGEIVMSTASAVPFAGGAAVGAYAGYKKMII